MIEGEDHNEPSDLVYMKMHDATSMEKSLSNNTFLHGRTYDSYLASVLIVMNER